MIRYLKVLIVMVVSVTMITGCNGGNSQKTSSNIQSDKKVNCDEGEVDTEVQELLMDLSYGKDGGLSAKLEWIKDKEWDEVLLSTKNSKDKVMLSDDVSKEFLECIDFSKEIFNTSIYNQIDPMYTFTLKSGENEIVIEVLLNDIYKIENRYFNANIEDLCKKCFSNNTK